MSVATHWLITMQLATRLVQLRKQKGLSQQALADAEGLHVTQIKRYESGATQPSLEALKKIAVTLGVTADFLLFDEAERGPDDELRLQFEAVSQLPPEEQAVVKEVLESLIIKYQARRWDTARAAAGRR
ncbi:HTH-type transcriptional regulator DdrOP3 [Anaerolineae bacterium]|nr:HTH-type transcriptional regulator DdrOP3 [Anaerolineae bacterium]